MYIKTPKPKTHSPGLPGSDHSSDTSSISRCRQVMNVSVSLLRKISLTTVCYTDVIK